MQMKQEVFSSAMFQPQMDVIYDGLAGKRALRDGL